MFNLVVLTGRLTADAELRHTQTNVPITNFTIAVDRKVKSGEERVADFINVIAWRSTAEFVSKYFKKGSMIGIEGAIQTRKYTDKDGNNRTAFEVVANNVHFIESKKTDGAPKGTENKADVFVEVSSDDDLPFN